MIFPVRKNTGFDSPRKGVGLSSSKECAYHEFPAGNYISTYYNTLKNNDESRRSSRIEMVDLIFIIDSFRFYGICQAYSIFSRAPYMDR